MDNFVQTVYQKLLNELLAVPELKKVSVKNPLLVGDRVRRSMEELKAHFREHPFREKGQEIQFFKYEKPLIVAEHIYAQELYDIESRKPSADAMLTETYYTEELAFIRRFFGQHRFLYQYYQLDGTDFDEAFFCRNQRPPEISLPEAPDFDPSFSTATDFLYSKFIAFERLQDHIADMLYGAAENGAAHGELRWTGEVINLVELIYGLSLTGQLNHGNVSLNEIVRWAENQLGVKIGVIQRRFTEIQGRKRVGTTKFIDQMRNSVQEKIEKLSA